MIIINSGEIKNDILNQNNYGTHINCTSNETL